MEFFNIISCYFKHSLLWVKNFNYLILELIIHFSYLYNLHTKCVDILLVHGEYHKNYRNSLSWSPNPQQIINIERRSRKKIYPLYRWKQQNQINNNNNQRLIVVLAMVHLNSYVSLWQIKRELRVPRSTVHRMLRSVNYYSLPYYTVPVKSLDSVFEMIH